MCAHVTVELRKALALTTRQPTGDSGVWGCRWQRVITAAGLTNTCCRNLMPLPQRLTLKHCRTPCVDFRAPVPNSLTVLEVFALPGSCVDDAVCLLSKWTVAVYLSTPVFIFLLSKEYIWLHESFFSYSCSCDIFSLLCSKLLLWRSGSQSCFYAFQYLFLNLLKMQWRWAKKEGERGYLVLSSKMIHCFTIFLLIIISVTQWL